MQLSLGQARQAIGLPPDQAYGDRAINGVAIDSRRLRRGELFVAIVGARFDGHDFVEQALSRGAAAVVVSRQQDIEIEPSVPVLRVDDTRMALGQLARAWRRDVSPTVVGITGSMGKTTTKELTHRVLSAAAASHRTQGNFNNQIGLPLTLLSMPQDTRFCVLEMGMSASGEIAALCQIAEPKLGVVTNVAPVHLEGLGSLEAIAAAKGELLAALPTQGTAIYVDTTSMLDSFVAHLPKGRRLRFGTGVDSDVRITGWRSLGERGAGLSLRCQGRERSFEFPLLGRHNAYNAAAAAAVGLALQLDFDRVIDALVEPLGLAGRCRLRRCQGWRIVDDCYNASPDSMRAGLRTLFDLAGQASTAAVLGPMLELGEASVAHHQQLGRWIAESMLSDLIVVGDQAAAIGEAACAAGMQGSARRVFFAPDNRQAVAELARRSPGWLLVKGSRGARLEQVVSALCDRADEEA